MSEEKPSEIVSQELQVIPKKPAVKAPVPHKHKVYKIVWRETTAP